MKKSDIQKPKQNKEEVDFTNITEDDIAQRFLELPPKPRTKKDIKPKKP
ncbi:MAG: hypothetical protein ACLPYB_12350 [Desulfobaccales bacterium]